MKNLVLSLVLTGISFASVSHAGVQTEIPSEEILLAARKIEPQTGPGYFVEGSLLCEIMSREFPPYGASATCWVTLKGETESFQPSDELISALTNIQPMTGPYYEFQAKFTGTSISREFPPYGASESVFVETKY